MKQGRVQVATYEKRGKVVPVYALYKIVNIERERQSRFTIDINAFPRSLGKQEVTAETLEQASSKVAQLLETKGRKGLMVLIKGAPAQA